MNKNQNKTKICANFVGKTAGLCDEISLNGPPLLSLLPRRTKNKTKL